MSWEKVVNRIKAEETKAGVQDKIIHIQDGYYYSVLGQALCNEAGTGFPKKKGDKPDLKTIMSLYKEQSESFEVFMVLCGAHYPDVKSLRVKVSTINSKIRAAWAQKHGLPDTEKAEAELNKHLLLGLRIKNPAGSLVPRARSVSEETAALEDHIDSLF
tara:strand:+ start:830 stop:1306 length:477 start_codon:yes stop_codon:yes gene_type:complete